MVRAFIACLLIGITFAFGWQHQPSEHTSFCRHPGCWERRMDRFETSHRRNGYALEKITKNSVAIVGYSLIGAGIGAGAVAALMLCLYAESQPPIPNHYPDIR